MSLKTATKLENGRVELEIEVDAATFGAAVDAAYKKDVKKMSVPGFRKGKAPRAMIEKMYGTGVFYDTAMNDVYPSALDEAIKESEYEYVEDKIDLDVVSVGPEGLVFKAVITVKPEVKMRGHKSLKITRPTVVVTDEDVNAELTRLQERGARMVSVEDRGAEMGDTVTFDFEGFVDGVAFEGGKAENHALVLGSGQFIPGFEESLVGATLDAELDVNVTFPEEYHAAELAGKPAVFKCKVHKIEKKELPEIDDELIKDCSDFDTVEEYKADAKKRIEDQRNAAADAEVDEKIADGLAKCLKADIPAAMIENTINDRIQDFAYRLQSQGLSMDLYLQYTGMDANAFRESFREQAEKQVKVRLALEYVVKTDKISVSDEELEAEFAKFAEQYGMEVEQVKAAIPAAALSEDIAVEKAMKFIRSKATITTEGEDAE
ncbi:MAG: trigger factor [Ruminococcaceae bacterium]|nr:trigger factor [Oscillospiraceae bacterium]